jgi:tetratricopeptide (TPR) repeat protein/tRNA A-37 threonylcarbamoyl transferase component Bud32
MADAFDRLKSALADRYAIERELGAGGMATVYLAEDLKLHRKVALKVLRPDLAASLGPDRFLQEIEIAAKLHHPHILPLYDSGDAEGFLYYVMPYEEGRSLRDKLAHEGELPVAEAVRILRDVVEALKHAHKHNVVHRDIKPDNVMLAEDHALVTDFGVAKAVSDATGAIGLTTEGVALGTPAYMSPEQASADRHIDHRADIYAVGVIAYELLTGRTPFVGNTQQELLAAHVTKTPDPVTKYRESVPPALAELVMKCLEKKAADRWQSAEELLPQVEALATPSGGVTATGTEPVEGRLKRSRMVATGAVVVAAIIAVIAVVFGIPRGSGVSLDSSLVAVAVFRNATGDRSLDQVGERAAHWVTQGLQQAAVHVTPWDGALQAWQYVQAEVDEGLIRDPIRAMAEETGAGTVVSGVVYLENDSLEIHANVTDAVRGRPLGTVDPARGPRESARDVIADMQRRLMGFLAIAFDERISPQASSVARPPSFEAYQEFDQGLDVYVRSSGYDPNVLPHFYAASALDTTFVSPLVYATLVNNNNGQWAQSDSLVGILARFRNQLSDYDRSWLEYLQARVDGDNPAALRAIRQAAELAPRSKAVYNRGWMARRNNRLREAVDAFLSLDPQRGPMRGWNYYPELVGVCLQLGEYENALNAVQEWREIYGESPGNLTGNALALAGLRRIDELNRLVDEMSALSEQDLDLGYWISRIAVYLRRQGHTDVARSAINRAVEWYDSRPLDVKATAAWSYRHAVALYVADRCDEAYSVAMPLLHEFPDDVVYRGFVGLLAACRGDQDTALTMSRWLASLDRPYLHGLNTMWRSAIAAALGDGENATALWRRATAEGDFALILVGDFRWIAFEPIRDYEPWQEVISPEG